MALKYALYPGCAAKGATPELYQSTMAIIGRLGIEVVELAAASCCGAGVVGEADPDTALALNARTFAQAEQLGLDIMTICGTCQGVMGSANKRLKEPGVLDRINQLLVHDGISYRGTIQVKHLLWIVVREIGVARLAEQVKVPMNDFRIAPFYGCYILRPSWDLGVDDPEILHRWRKSFKRWVVSRSSTRDAPSVADFPSSWKRKPLPLQWPGRI